MLYLSDAIHTHIIQWAQEKNRKIRNGYNYEVINSCISLLSMPVST